MRKLESERIKALKEYFQKEPCVTLAFLFGSFAKGRQMEESDFDVAVHLKDTKREDKIRSVISKITKKNVDLLLLNEAPATLISNIFKKGVPLAIKDKRFYGELYLKVSSETEDFLEFLKDFFRIKEKAKSIDKEEEVRLKIRIDFLKTEMEELDRFKNLTKKEYTEDRDKRKLIERWAENIINAIIDITKMVLASEKKLAPRSYEEALLNFGFLIGLEEKESERLSKFAKLRNILAHEYLDILYREIQYFIKEFPKFYKKVLSFLENYLR